MRTIGWMYIARIVFNQALILWAFQRYEGRRLSQIILSATLVFVLSSDNLAPLNLAAILTAFLFKDWDICRKKRNINLIKMFLNLKQLGKLYVWLPSILMSLLMVIIFFLGRLKIFGIYETTFERSFFGHVTADAVQEGHTIKFNLSPARMFHSMTYLFGELSIPIIFLSLIGLIWMLKNNRFKKYGLTSYFALISSLGYSILWFFLYSDFSGGDFIVSLCLPFILTVVIWANEIISKHAIPAITIIVALAVSSAAANLELVWNKNGILFIDNPYKTSTTASYSILKDNVGNKSIGFLIREIMKLSLKDGKINTFQFSGNDLTNRYSALRAFAGLTQDAQDLSCQFKAKLIFTESIDSRTICQLPCSKSSNPKIIVIKIQSVATAANDNFTSEKICHAFNFKDHTGVAKTTLFVITDNSSLSLYCHPGDYPVDIFDQLYDSTYNKLYDYYPISL